MHALVWPIGKEHFTLIIISPCSSSDWLLKVQEMCKEIYKKLGEDSDFLLQLFQRFGFGFTAELLVMMQTNLCCSPKTYPVKGRIAFSNVSQMIFGSKTCGTWICLGAPKTLHAMNKTVQSCERCIFIWLTTRPFRPFIVSFICKQRHSVWCI